MKDCIEEHDEYKKIRLSYPENLDDKQIDELVEIFPADPVDQGVFLCCLSYTGTFNDSENKLYRKYKLKLVKTDVKHAIEDHGPSGFDKSIAKLQGMVLFNSIQQIFSELGNLPEQIKKNYEGGKIVGEERFLVWKENTPSELFELQKVGFLKGIEINEKCMGVRDFSKYMRKLIDIQ